MTKRKKFSGTRGSCSDYFESAANIRDNLFQPLRAGGAVLRVFFHTYAHPTCKEADAALVRSMQPVAHEFSTALLPRICDSYLRALALVMAWTPPAEWAAGGPGAAAEDHGVMLVRFDVKYLWPLTRERIDWSAFNVAWRDELKEWRKWRTANDQLFIFPARALGYVSNAIHKSGQRYKSGSAHYTLKYLEEPLAVRLGMRCVYLAAEFHSSWHHYEMVEKRLRDARLGLWHQPNATPAPPMWRIPEQDALEVFLAIERACDISVRCDKPRLAGFNVSLAA